MNNRGLGVRFIVCGFFMTMAMTGLGFRLGYLHLGRHEEVRQKIVQSRKYERELLAGRGNVFDRRGRDNLMALNLVVKDVCADPSAIVRSNNLLRVTERLCSALSLPSDAVAMRLNQPDRRFAYVKRFAHEEEVREIEREDIPGVFFKDATIRYYPQRSMMCHVLGYVNHEGVGSAGVEQFMDKYLRGSPGFVESNVDALRHELYWKRGAYIPPLEGADIYLTLDQNLQYVVEKEADSAMAEHHARGVYVIVQHVRTGQILAMVSRPCFDLNEFNTADHEEMRNGTIGEVYEPGSTFKTCVIAAALDRRTVTPETVFDCENGTWVYKGRALRSYHPYGRLTVADILKKSDNVGAAKIGLTLGNNVLHDYLRAFGVGRKLGIDLPGEEGGILAPTARWSGISCTRISIGQGVAVTALQMLGMMCAIANDGFLMRPHVVERVLTHDGALLLKTQPEVLAKPITSDTAALMRRLLTRVTEEGGTGLRARVEGYSVAGKTGSAQKPEGGGYSSTAYMASFVGFLPAEDPEIGIIVVMDEPQPYHTGGVVAAPVFARIAAQAVRYLDIESRAPALAEATREQTSRPN